MSQTIETNLVDILNRLDQRMDRFEQKLDDIKQDIATLKGQNEQINKRLEEMNNRINDTNNRINTLTIGFLSIVGIFVTALLTIIGKLVFFPNPSI
jgi:predicted  nucleic acid-binding Zn-ribbon protein